MRLFIVLTISLISALSAYAQEPQTPSPLTFQAWKDQQVLEAQNQVLRVSARISTLRTTRPSTTKKEPAHLANGRLKKVADGDTLAAAEQDLKTAQDVLARANNLQFDDYVDAYIPTLANQPELLQKLAEKLTKDDLAAILKGVMNQSTNYDAKRSAAIAEGLSVGPRSKTP